MDEVGLRPFLECKICLKIPSGKVYLCENSHKICQRCYEKLSQRECPLGKCQYKRPEPFRARDIEDLISQCQFDFSCCFDGCTVEAKSKDAIAEHEETCAHRKVPCISHGLLCGNIKMFDMSTHLKTEHEIELYKNGEETDVYEGAFFYPAEASNNFYGSGGTAQFVHDGHTFFYTIWVDFGLFIVWTSVNGLSNVADKYQCKMLLENKDTKLSVQANLHVLPLDTIREHIGETGNGLFIGIHQFRRLMSDCTDEKAQEDGYVKMVSAKVSIQKRDQSMIENINEVVQVGL